MSLLRRDVLSGSVIQVKMIGGGVKTLKDVTVILCFEDVTWSRSHSGVHGSITANDTEVTEQSRAGFSLQLGWIINRHSCVYSIHCCSHNLGTVGER